MNPSSVLNQDLSSEIREVNLSYLLLVQRMLRDDFAAGMYRTGLTDDAAQTLISLSLAQLVALASSSALICGFRLNDGSLLSTLSKSGMGGILQQARTTMALQNHAMQLQDVQ